MKMDLKLNIFTLNCWGITWVSRHRKQRMEAIADHIAQSNYDFVFLQEVWRKDDFDLICQKSSHILPYTYYFHSGVLGSGVCLLSVSPIVDSAQCQYSLNGYAHKILHGDWYGGKVVGLCQVLHHGLKINLYVTHLHAEYNSLDDQYLAHRVAQAFEFSQFVKLTSETADLSIVAGDFNSEPTDLTYRVILHNSGCLDAYCAQTAISTNSSIEKTTCGHPENLYTSSKELCQRPNGQRIDYILFKYGLGTHVDCLSCDTPLDKIPGTSIPYSDHEAIVAQLHVFKTLDAQQQMWDPKSHLEAIDSSHGILQKSLKELQGNRYLYLILSSLLAALLLVTTFIDNIGFLSIVLVILQFVATIVLAFCLWMAIIVTKIEDSALTSACKSMEILTNALVNEHNLPVVVTSGNPSSVR